MMQNSVAKNYFSRLALTAVALTALAGMARSVQAQVPSLPGRVFTPTLIGSGTTIDPYTAHTPVVNGQAYPVSAKTEVVVNPYLYVSGNLDLLFTVDGWGAGSSSYDTTFAVWHNMKITLSLSAFGNPTASNDATKSLPMNISSTVTDTATNTWFTSTSAPAYTGITNWTELTTSSLGHFTVTLTRQITLDATIGPLPTGDMYVNTAAINVTPSW